MYAISVQMHYVIFSVLVFHSCAKKLFLRSTQTGIKHWKLSLVCSIAYSCLSTILLLLTLNHVVQIEIDDIAMVNYALIGAPVFTGSYIETNHKVKTSGLSR